MGSQRRFDRYAPLLAVLAAACCWSTLGVGYQLILEDVDIHPITLVTIRATAAMLFVNAFLLARPSRFPVSLTTLRVVVVPVIILGLVSIALFYVSLIYAFEEAGVAVTTVLLYLAPPMVALGGWLVFGTRVTRWQLVSISIAFIGVVAVALGGGDAGELSLLGVMLGVVSAGTYATYSLAGQVAIARVPALVVVGCSLAIGTAVLWVVKLAVDGLALPNWNAVVAIALVSGLGATVAPLLLYTWGLSRIGPSKASLMASAEPALAVLLAYLILGERFHPFQALGAVIVLVGLTLSNLERVEQ